MLNLHRGKKIKIVGENDQEMGRSVLIVSKDAEDLFLVIQCNSGTVIKIRDNPAPAPFVARRAKGASKTFLSLAPIDEEL